MTKTTIVSIVGRRVWDSRGRPTVEADVRLEGGAVGRAIAPAGASRGSGEATDLRDGGERFGGFGVEGAVANVNGAIAAALRGQDATDQAAVDHALERLDGTPGFSRLGGNAAIAVSMAVLHAAANASGQPLFAYLARGAAVRLPMPEIQVFGGGAHAGGRVDVQDFMVVPVGAGSFAEALEMTADVYRAAGELMAGAGKLRGVADEGGYWPDFAANEEALDMLVRAIERSGHVPGGEVAISLDIAASELGRKGRTGSRSRTANSTAMRSRSCGFAGSSAIPSFPSRTRLARTIRREWHGSPRPPGSACRSWATTFSSPARRGSGRRRSGAPATRSS